RARDAAARRPPRRHLLPFARGPDREAVPARAGTRLHLPARLPRLRLRQRARAPRPAAAAHPTGPGGSCRESALGLGTPAGRREDGRDGQRAQLKAQNQALASRLSAASSAPRIEEAAHRLGLVQAPAVDTSYLDLAPGRP